MKLLELPQVQLLEWGRKLPEWDICGIPTGRRYKPWHSARVGKRGLSGNWVRIKIGTGSPQHSLIEAKALAKFDFHTWVLEVRSQYPFWDAEKYLRYYRAGRSFPKTSVATFDFMLTLCIPWTQQLHYHCVSIKPSEQLDDAKVVRRHEREAKWCAERGITWEFLTERDFPDAEYGNYKVLKRFLREANITRQMENAREYAERVIRSSASGSLNHLLKCANRRWTLLECYQMFGIAVLMGWLRLDNRFPLGEDKPLFLEKL